MDASSEFANLESGLAEPPPQEGEEEEEAKISSYIIEPKVARPILVVSQLMLVTIVHGLFRQAYGAALMGTLLYISSINFWRSPEKGWRRNLDYFCVALSFIYFTLLAVRLGGDYVLVWFIGRGVIAAIFAVNETKFWLNDSKTLNDYKLAVFVHAFGVHVLSNALANVVLIGMGTLQRNIYF